ncbi:conserved hypothetical protein [Methylocella silvestris BL2]|uniref:Uncharacterized protein n=1 Tax=Methylocella silvestris (strain DSM 15510 / CIP 108128 / LMG 27833 / NCIMB 13906 / BL2) TaxID=395965 RepID=B8ERS0_METSB|nr:hypothetical protein [Methylocella silvestris]ACK51618.1 conserved hypothetical protein [Methylocella silvestris BL2]
MPENAHIAKRSGLIGLMIVAACSGARAQDARVQCHCYVLPPAGQAMQDDPFWDEFGHYFQRIDRASVVSGDARDVNAVTHIIDPWPRYVGNRRIPANGQRMVGAIDRYQNPKLLGAKAPTLSPIIVQSLTGSGGSDSGSSGMGGGGGQ